MEYESTKKYYKLIALLRKVVILLGVNMFDPNYKINGLTIFMITLASSVTVSYLFMLLQKPTVMFIFEGLVMVTLTLQGLAKLTVTAIDNKQLTGLFNRLRHMYEDDEKVYENQSSLNKCIDACRLLYKLLALCYVGVLTIYCLSPILQYYFTNTFQTIFPTHLPYLDTTSTVGYVVNLVHQYAIIILGCIGILTFDIMFITYITHLIPAVNLLRIRLNELNEELESGSNDTAKIKEKIDSSIVQHQTIISYIAAINHTFSNTGAIQIISAAFALVLSIFLFVWKKWIVGPILCIAAIFQIGEYCIMGTVCQIQNDEVATLIYNCLWYLMPVPEQKLILQMLMQALTPRELEAGKFANLNVATYMQVLKMAYSFTMMIIEFFN